MLRQSSLIYHIETRGYISSELDPSSSRPGSKYRQHTGVPQCHADKTRTCRFSSRSCAPYSYHSNVNDAQLEYREDWDQMILQAYLVAKSGKEWRVTRRMHMQRTAKKETVLYGSDIIPTRQKDKPTQREQNSKTASPPRQWVRRGWEKAVHNCGKQKIGNKNIVFCEKRKTRTDLSKGRYCEIVNEMILRFE